MSDTPYNEEEEFQTSFNGRTILRILGLTKPHWRWLAGFLAMIIAVAVIESFRTYITKQIIDNGILAGNRDALTGLALRYGALVVVQSAGVFGPEQGARMTGVKAGVTWAVPPKTGGEPVRNSNTFSWPARSRPFTVRLVRATTWFVLGALPRLSTRLAVSMRT